METTNTVAIVSHVTPEQVTQQFNAWMAVFMLIGGVAWHAILRIWPSLKAVYPWIVSNGGIGPIIWRFFYNPPKTSEISAIKLRNINEPTPDATGLVENIKTVPLTIDALAPPPAQPQPNKQA